MKIKLLNKKKVAEVRINGIIQSLMD